MAKGRRRDPSPFPCALRGKPAQGSCSPGGETKYARIRLETMGGTSVQQVRLCQKHRLKAERDGVLVKGSKR